MVAVLSRADVLRGRLAGSGEPAAAIPSDQRRAQVGAGCLALSGIACRACQDHCPPLAIRFRPALGGRAIPDIQAARCDGCGACLPICPVAALTLEEIAS